MSSKNDILSAIRRHTGKRYDMPELTLDAITYEDKILQFTDSLKAAGGQVVLMQPGDDINDIIRHHFPDAIRIASNLSSITCATFNPDDLDDPRELDNTDLAIVEGHFGVAENGAVWITGCYRMIRVARGHGIVRMARSHGIVRITGRDRVIRVVRRGRSGRWL